MGKWDERGVEEHFCMEEKSYDWGVGKGVLWVMSHSVSCTALWWIQLHGSLSMLMSHFTDE